MDLVKNIIICILILLIVSLAQGVSGSENTAGLPPGTIIRTAGQAAAMDPGEDYFVDYVPLEGVDHLHPDPYLAADLNARLLTAKMGQLGYRQDEIAAEVSRLDIPWPRYGLPSTGDVKMLVLLVEFPDAPHAAVQTVEDIGLNVFGAGDPDRYFPISLAEYYRRSSYNQLNISGNVLGWYMAAHNRSYYADLGIGEGYELLMMEALDHYNSAGHDFSQYDNDNNGRIDYIMVKYAGDIGTWGTFWWAYSVKWSNNPSYTLDGKKMGNYVWSMYTSSYDDRYSNNVDIHETGHNLGLPDYYDYESSEQVLVNGIWMTRYQAGNDTGPRWGLGNFDMMDGNRVDHNAFSKYLLGWTTPVVIGTLPSQSLRTLSPSGANPDQAFLIMPGATLDSYSEFFMVENRVPGYGSDIPSIYWGWNKGGLAVWHVDATLDPDGTGFLYDNSRTGHNLIRVEEADGLGEIQRGYGWDQEDLYVPGTFFGPGSTPNSSSYAGADTQIRIHDISMPDTIASAMFTLGEYPPTVTAITPPSGTTNTLMTVSRLQGGGFWTSPKPTVYIRYRKLVGDNYEWFRENATNVSVVSRTWITCTFDLTGIPEGTWTVFVANPDGKVGSLNSGITVEPPSVRVTAPNGGEAWPAGTTQTITWTQAGLTGTDLKVELWKDSPGTRQAVIAGAVMAENCSTGWEIPAAIALSARYWINISSADDPAVSDVSDAFFKITPVPVLALSVKNSVSRDNATWADDSIIVPSGSRVYYNVTVKNTGNTLLQSVVVRDGTLHRTYSDLAAGNVWSLYYSYTAGTGTTVNTAAATGTSAYGNPPPVSDTATYYPVIPLKGYTSPPTDPDDDGIYEDLNVNGRKDFADIVLYFNQMSWIAANEPVPAFDLNHNSRIDFADIVALFNEI